MNVEGNIRSVGRRLEDLGFEGRTLLMVLAREIFTTDRRPLEGRRQHQTASSQARSSLCQYDRFGIDDAINVEQAMSRGAASTGSGCFDLRRTLVTRRMNTSCKHLSASLFERDRV